MPLVRRITGGLLRAVAVVAIVLACGFGAGKLLGAAIAKVPDPTGGAEVIDHFTLASSLVAKTALAQAGDLPSGWKAGPATFGLVGLPICGKSADDSPSPLGARQTREPIVSWVDSTGKQILISEVVEFGSTQQASTYIGRVTTAYEKCKGYSYTDTTQNKEIKFTVTPPEDKAPVTDYVSRVIQPTDHSRYEVVTYFQAGKAIVTLHYVGPSRPTRGMMAKVEQKVLARIAPDKFGVTATTVKGEKPLPADTEVTIPADQLKPAGGTDPAAGAPAATLTPDPTAPPTTAAATETTGRSSQGD